MERLLHYVWAHRLFPAAGLVTADGETVRVLSPGLHNKDAGPDFYSADVVIGTQDWMGTVEIHTRSSDWYRHSHHTDPAYNNVILHVVEQADREVQTQSGRTVPQVVVTVPDHVVSHYEQLQAVVDTPPCHSRVAGEPPFLVKQWLSRLGRERLERKAADVMQRVQQCNYDWEHVFFITLARAFGFGINADAFEHWARTIPYSGAAKHRDNLFQIQALFLGQAGFLDISQGEEVSILFEDKQADAAKQFSQLCSEYHFLAGKFGLTPLSAHRWRFMRTRPQSFPTVRLMQLAKLYCEGDISLSAMVDCHNAADAMQLLTRGTGRRLSQFAAEGIIINAVVPVLYAYGRYRSTPSLSNRVGQWLTQLTAERNRYVQHWQQCGMPVLTAADSQAVVQLATRLCERRDCLRCWLGQRYLKS